MYGMFKFYNVIFTLLMLCVSFKALSESNKSNKITLNQIESIQNEWAKGLINIGAEYEKKGDYRQVALNLINQLYAFNYGNNIVLFKPTKASTHPFRRTKESALSYFVGGNDSFDEDKGFALAPWKDIKFTNDQIFFHNDLAIVMGHYVFTDTKGNSAKVEYTFGYIQTQKDGLKIILQHSSLPYSK